VSEPARAQEHPLPRRSGVNQSAGGKTSKISREGVGAPAHDREPSLAPVDPRSADAIVRLQRSAGNFAVTRLLEPGLGTASSAVQRQSRVTAAAPAEPRSSGAEPEVDVASALARLGLEHLRITATASTFLAGAYAERGLRTVDALKSSLVRASDTYGGAYGNYAKVIRAARQEALNQQDWTNIVVGIAIGTSVGLLAGAIVPEGLALGWTIMAEAAGEVVEAGAGAGVQATGLTDVAGTDLEPAGLDPDVLRSDIWQHLAGLYRSAVGVQRHTQYLPLLLGNAEYALGQFRLLDAGAPADMSRTNTIEMAGALSRASTHLEQLNAELWQRLTALDQLAARVAAAPRPTVDQMEQDIWIMWMADLGNAQSDILDLDEIEDHLASIGILGAGGLLGVDFGWWTSEDDELEALSAARAQAGAIRSRYRALSES